jgi:hypothetical protein
MPASDDPKKPIAPSPWKQPLPAQRVTVPTIGRMPIRNDTISSLERLQRLKEAGALSSEEFEAEKKRALGDRRSRHGRRSAGGLRFEPETVDQLPFKSIFCGLSIAYPIQQEKL